MKIKRHGEAVRMLRPTPSGELVAGPWRPARRRRIDWGVVGAVLFGAVWGFLFGLSF